MQRSTYKSLPNWGLSLTQSKQNSSICVRNSQRIRAYTRYLISESGKACPSFSSKKSLISAMVSLG